MFAHCTALLWQKYRSLPSVKLAHRRQNVVLRTMSFFKFIGRITCRPAAGEPETFGFILSRSVGGTLVLIKTDA